MLNYNGLITALDRKGIAYTLGDTDHGKLIKFKTKSKKEVEACFYRHSENKPIRYADICMPQKRLGKLGKKLAALKTSILNKLNLKEKNPPTQRLHSLGKSFSYNNAGDRIKVTRDTFFENLLVDQGKMTIIETKIEIKKGSTGKTFEIVRTDVPLRKPEQPIIERTERITYPKNQ